MTFSIRVDGLGLAGPGRGPNPSVPEACLNRAGDATRVPASGLRWWLEQSDRLTIAIAIAIAVAIAIAIAIAIVIASASPWFGGLLLIAAGVQPLTPLKHICPRHRRPGPNGACAWVWSTARSLSAAARW
jgi:predicted metal-binding membrane protein